MGKSKRGPGPTAAQMAIAAGIAKMAKEKQEKTGKSEDAGAVYSTKMKKGETATGFNDPDYIKRSYEPEVQKEYKRPDTSSMRDNYIRSGLAIEKEGGDFFPTPKYYELNKQGKVDSYLKEFLKREDVEYKVANENAGKKIYEKGQVRRPVGSAKESMKNY